MTASLALSFDNLGEAADLERGLWPEDRPLGCHPSVLAALPALLDLLDALELRATFCVEAYNCGLYPEALGDVVRRGHELAVHGWRHERWSALTPEREESLLRRSRGAFAALDLAPTGFRPPGGGLTAASTRLLTANGFRWVSGAADVRVDDPGLASVPFSWPLVDAYYALPSFAELRERTGDAWAALPPARVALRLRAELDRVVASGADAVLILHPFLALDDEGQAAMCLVLEHVRALDASGALRATSVHEAVEMRGARTAPPRRAPRAGGGSN